MPNITNTTIINFTTRDRITEHVSNLYELSSIEIAHHNLKKKGYTFSLSLTRNNNPDYCYYPQYDYTVHAITYKNNTVEETKDISALINPSTGQDVENLINNWVEEKISNLKKANTIPLHITPNPASLSGLFGS